MGIKRIIYFVAWMLLTLPIAFAQTTVVNGTIVDPGGNIWANAIVTAQFQQAPNTPGPYTWSGGAFNPQPAPVVADSAGVFTITLPSNTAIVPSGSTWQFQVAPNATLPAAVVNVALSGGTLNLIPIITASGAWPVGKVPGTFISKAYNTSQVGNVPLDVGAMIYNTSTKLLEFWNGIVWAPIGSGGGGGGNVLASPQFQIGYYPSAGTQAIIQGIPSGFSSDINGNVRAKSYDGSKEAFYNQTAPGANNGIATALAAPGSIVVASPDYASVEGVASGNSTCVGSNWRDAIGCPPPFANNSILMDFRPIGIGNYYYNLNMGPFQGIYNDSRYVSNQQVQTAHDGRNLFGDFRDWELTGSGIDGFTATGGPDSFAPFFWSFELLTRGIMSIFNINESAESHGDNHIWQTEITDNRGTVEGSDEGLAIFRNDIHQNLTPFTMNAGATFTPGATVIFGTQTGNVPFLGDGTYVINATTASSLFNLVSCTDPGVPNAGECIIDTLTLVPDINGRIAAAITIPQLYNGATTNVTFTASALTASIVAGQSICVADNSNQESATIISPGTFSGGNQTITAALRYNHLNNAYIAQGAHACSFIEVKANEYPGPPAARHLMRVIEANASNKILYSRTVAGNWKALLSGFAGTNIIAPAGTTLTRNGSNVVTAAVTDPFLNLAKDFIIVPAGSCTDHSFEGFWILTSDTGSTVTWTNAGAAGSTTCTKAIEIQSQLNGFPIRQAQLFTGAEIVNTNDPTTFALNGKFSIEPNTRFVITAGNSIENQVLPDVNMGIDHNLMSFRTQTSVSNNNVAHAEVFSDQITDSFAWTAISLQEPGSDYQGRGGSKVFPPIVFDMTHSSTPISVYFNGLLAPDNALITISSCAFGCTSTRSQFDIISAPTQNGFFSWHIRQDTGILEQVTNNATNNFTFRIQPEGMNVIATGTGAGSIYQFLPSTFKSTVGGGAGTSSVINQLSSQFETDVIGVFGIDSHVIQTNTAWTSDVPIVVPSCTGCGGAGGTGTVTNVAVGNLAPLFTTVVSNPTTTATAVYTLNPLAAFIAFANTTIAMPTTAIGANSCTAGTPVTITGVGASNTFPASYATDPTGVTGWGSSGGLVFAAWPTTNTLNWTVCNQTAAPITGGAISLIVGVR